MADIRMPTVAVNLPAELVAKMEDLKKSDGVKIRYNDRFYSVNRVSTQLARDLASCQRCEKQLESKEQTLEAKERSLDAARDQLASMKTEKEKLELLVTQMEADLKTLRLSQTRSQFHLDDSRLSSIKARLDDIRDQMRAQQTASELCGEFLNDTIPVDKKVTQSKDQVIQAAEEYLSESSPASSVAVQKP